MERWDVYDWDRKATGRTMARGSLPEEGAFHLVVHVCAFDTAGRMLIQRRHTAKPIWPGLWDLTAGGAALAGESGAQAAEREALEELGLRVSLKGLRPVLTVAFETGFDDFFLASANAEIGSLRLQAEEVLGARWASREEILRLAAAGDFVPYHRSFIGLLFDFHAHGSIFGRGA